MELFALIITTSITMFALYYAAKSYSNLYHQNQALREEIVRIIAERDFCDCDEAVKILPNTNKYK